MVIEIPTHDRKSHQQWWRDLQGITFSGPRAYTHPVRRFDSKWALRILDRDDLHPGDVHAVAWPTRNAALLSARANREAWGIPTLGVVNVEPLGWVVVMDLRPALAEHGVPPRRPPGR